jgi:hypothetical protein
MGLGATGTLNQKELAFHPAVTDLTQRNRSAQKPFVVMEDDP